MLLNNQWITEEIREEIKNYLEINDKNMTILSKHMGYRKRNSRREVYNNTILLQETRKISNKWSNLACKAVRERGTNKSWSYKEEIINIKTEINERGKEKNRKDQWN